MPAPSSPSHPLRMSPSLLSTAIFLLLSFAGVARAAFTVENVVECGQAVISESAASQGVEQWSASVLFTGQPGSVETIPCTGGICSWRVDLPAGASIDICSSLSNSCFPSTVTAGTSTTCLGQNPGANEGLISSMASVISASSAGTGPSTSRSANATTAPATTSKGGATATPASPSGTPQSTGNTTAPAKTTPDVSNKGSGPLPIVGGLLGGLAALALFTFLGLKIRGQRQRRLRQNVLARAAYSPYFLPSERGSVMSEATRSTAARRSGVSLDAATRASRRTSWRRDGVDVLDVDVPIDVSDAGTLGSSEGPRASAVEPPAAATFFAPAQEEKSAESYASLGFEREGRRTDSYPSVHLSYLSPPSTAPPPLTPSAVSTDGSEARRPPSYNVLRVDTGARPPSYDSDGARRSVAAVAVPVPDLPAPPSAVSPSPDSARGRRIPPPVWRASRASRPE